MYIGVINLHVQCRKLMTHRLIDVTNPLRLTTFISASNDDNSSIVSRLLDKNFPSLGISQCHHYGIPKGDDIGKSPRGENESDDAGKILS